MKLCFAGGKNRAALMTTMVASGLLFGARGLSTATTANQRAFRYVPYGKSFEPEDDKKKTISCDGRIPGTSLELTHWNGNDTPDSLYADTSTEMALNFIQQDDDYEAFHDAYVLNNHYDTDGVLSSWTCLADPELALSYKQLLIQGAEAGDFGEWSSDEGVKLDLIILAMCSDDEAASYETVFEELPSLLRDMKATGGKAYDYLWKPGFDQVLSDWDDIQQGRVTLSRGPGRMVIVTEKPGGSQEQLSSFALDRGMREQGLWKDTTRILRVHTVEDKYRYGYEKVGHGWVNKLVQRPSVPNANGKELATALNQRGEGCWSVGGKSGLVSLCQTKGTANIEPEEVENLLLELDEGCRRQSSADLRL